MQAIQTLFRTNAALDILRQACEPMSVHDLIDAFSSRYNLSLTHLQAYGTVVQLRKQGRVFTRKDIATGIVMVFLPEDAISTPKVPLVKPSIPAPPSNVEEALDRRDPKTSALEDRLSLIGVQLADVILSALEKRLSETLEARVAGMVERLVTDRIAVPILKQAVPLQDAVKRRIGVIGLLADQQNVISNEFGSEFKIAFSDGKSGASKIRSIGASCEVVFLHTDHIAHWVENTLKGVHANLVWVPGGVSSMKEALTKYYCDHS